MKKIDNPEEKRGEDIDKCTSDKKLWTVSVNCVALSTIVLTIYLKFID